MVMSCDALETRGQQILGQLLQVHFNVCRDSINIDMLAVAAITEKWRPISKTPFFDINKSCLSKMFTSVVTYLVILIQFHLGLDETNEKIFNK